MRLELNRKTDLALRALQTLASAGVGDDHRCKSSEIAAAIDASAQYLPQVMAPLVRRGWVASDPGPTGGYRLIVSPEDISLLDLIETMEGPTKNHQCALDGGDCDETRPCAIHDPWVEARDALLARLAATTMAEMAGARRNGR